MTKPKKIFLRLFIPYFFISLTGLLILLLIVRFAFQNFYYNEITNSLTQKAKIIESSLVESLGMNNIPALKELVTDWSKKSESRITVIKADGNVVADSSYDATMMENHLEREEIRIAMSGEVGTSLRNSSTLTDKYLYIALPLKRNGEILGVVRNAVSVKELQVSLYALTNKIFFWSFVLLLFITYFIYHQARKLSTPLEQMKKNVEIFALSDFKDSFNFEKSSTEEIASLSFALQKMGENLKNKIEKIGTQKNEQLAVFSSLREGVITIYPDLTIYNINRAASNLFNVTINDSIHGSLLEDVVDSEFIVKLAKKLVDDQSPVEEEINYGAGKILHVYGSLVESKETGTFGAILVFEDISKVRRLEDHRKQFVANVSHELKTPLTAIQGYLETLLESNIEEEAMKEKFLKIINKHTLRLKLIIEDLLSLSSLEKDNEIARMDTESQGIISIIEGSASLCLDKSNREGISIDISGEEVELKVSKSLMEQAFINLFDNAIKYGGMGTKINVSIKNSENNVEIIVSDNGPGIAEEHHARLFERFYSADKARSRSLGGSGLGLAIVKHIVLSHGGDIQVTSTLGQGTDFIIELPC